MAAARSVEVLKPMTTIVLLLVAWSKTGVAALPEPNVIGEPGASLWLSELYPPLEFAPNIWLSMVRAAGAAGTSGVKLASSVWVLGLKTSIL